MENFLKEGTHDSDVVDEDSSKEDSAFSYEVLVMRAVNKMINLGMREMCPGYWNTKVDKFGNASRMYIEDSRKAFISSVKTLMVLLEVKFSIEKEEIKQIVRKINKLLSDYDEFNNKLKQKEKNDIENAPTPLKKQRIASGIYYREGHLNTNLPYSNESIEEELETYRKVATELVKLINAANLGMGIAGEA